MSLIPVTRRDLFWSDPFFESAWGPDFNLLRGDMMREHQRTWDRFGHEFIDDRGNRCTDCKPEAITDGNKDGSKKKRVEKGKEGKRETDGTMVERNEDKEMVCPWFMPPRRWLGPSFGFGEETSRANQLMRVKEDDNKFEVSLDTHEYGPDELKINVVDNLMSVEGKHEEKSEDGNSYVSRHFVRKYTLPRGCEAENINSNLSSDGVLMITALKNPALMSSSRAVAIQEHQQQQQQPM